MERGVFSVEWLAQSSQRKATLPNVDSLNCRRGHAAGLQFGLHGEYSAYVSSRSKEDSTSAADCSEKENHGFKNKVNEEKVAPNERQWIVQPQLQEQGKPREVLKEISVWGQRQVKDDDGSSEGDSTRSPGSLCDDETSSRPRTKFSSEQLEELETSFNEHRYIGSSEKKRLARVLKLSEIQIKTWFQNRRMKFKRQSQDARVEAFFSGLYLPYGGYSDPQTPGCSKLSDFAVPISPPAPALPFAPIQSAMISPGLHTAPIPAAHLGSYQYSSMALHPRLSECSRRRFNPY
ncbi:hypothetical protein FKM82_014388 [Ascaphus truei]